MAKVDMLDIRVKSGEEGSVLLTMYHTKRYGIHLRDVIARISKDLNEVGGEFVLETSVGSRGVTISWRPVTENADGDILDPLAPDEVVPEGPVSETAAREDEDIYAYLDRRYEELKGQNDE